ncbi:MAG TPA: CpsB/CapC family capsule biosynthesis tyrosine phosphatase [Puia sp.]|nr:CpsB/CapC family capsule biosynthesis tyrosine phosphatase [Puia sp.]
MLSIFKTRGAGLPADFSPLGADMHSHLIPGIDDGVPDLDTALAMIRGLVELGYKKLITTPHIYSDMFPNTPETILPGHKIVAAAIREQNIPVEFHAAAEYLIDERFERLLDSNMPLLTLKENFILVELPFVVPAMNLKEILFKIQMSGYLPVLAHPERYLYFGANKGWYDQLRDAGCLFQLNLLSLTGHYGKDSVELAQFLIKKQYIDLLGTDLHHERHLAMLRSSSSKILPVVNKLIDSGKIRNAGL